MRLVHVVPTYLPARRYGGPIVAVHGLCRALAARGHDVEVYTTSIDGPSDSPVPHDKPVMLDGVTVRYFASPYLRRLSYAPALERALRGSMAQFDVAHLHSVFLWPTWRAARIAEAAKVPYVISPRGILVKRLIASRSRWIKTAWIALIERSNLERAAAVHATSEVERRELEQFVSELDEDVANEPRTFTVQSGGDFVLTPRKLLFHCLLHETRHWAQIALAIRRSGLEPPGNHDLFYSKAMK